VRHYDDAPYTSVNQALRSAYGSEGRYVIQMSQAIAGLRGGGVRIRPNPYWEGLTAWERVAQAALTLLLVRQTLQGVKLLVVEAHYTVPADDNLTLRKQGRLIALSERVCGAIDTKPDSRYLLAAVAAWAGFGELDDKEWSKQLSVHTKTLQRWRVGRGEYGQGITGVLDDWLDGARRELGGPMREAGLIQ
jgi:hypothetical protein